MEMSMGARDTDKDWEAIAKQDPYWGVLSVDEFRGKELGEGDLVKFFQSGDVFIGNLMGLIHAHIARDFSPRRTLDFGCGVGRLLAPLARISQEVVGVDVAPEMLKICRSNMQRLGISNYSLALSDDRLSQVNGEFGFINTYIVLQHIPPERGYRILSSLLSKLQIGGCGSIQLTYGKDRQYLQHEIGAARAYRRDGNTIVDLLPVEDASAIGKIVMYDYDLNQIVAMISEIAGQPILVLPTRDDNHMGVHLVFARSR
jgi:SAM-dependent methyltransferase